mgnify:CR=1 FL=1
MKKICLSFLLMFILTLICGCSNAMGDNSSKYKCDAISEGVYCLDENTSSVYPYENKFYHVNYENGNIGYSESETMKYHLLCTLEKDTLNDVYVDIYVDDTGIYVSGDYVVYVIDFDGNIIDRINLPDTGAYWYSHRLAANKKYITVCCSYKMTKEAEWENVIYVIDRKTNKISTYDYTKVRDGDTLERIIPTNKENDFILVGNHQVYSFNATNGKYDMVYDGVNGYIVDYSPNDNCLYFMDQSNTSGEILIGRITLPSGEINVVRNTNEEYIFARIKPVVEAAGKEAKGSYFVTVFYTESGFMFWTQSNSVIWVLPEEVNDTGEEITVIYRNSPSIVTLHSSDYVSEFGWMHGIMERMNTQFEEENKIAVNAKGYAHDKFVENLRVKLLAGDDDYDVVMLEHTDELLASILNYNLYLPLEAYDSISSGFDKYFDGVRDVMSYNGHIFGIPYYLTVEGFTSEDNTIDKLSPDYTLDDFWKLCEEFGSSRIMFCTKLTNHKPFYYIISSVLEDGMRKGDISRDTLLECIETYMKYRKAGSLNLNPPGDGPLRIIGGIGGTLDAKFSLSNREYKGLRSLPTYDGKRYFNIKSMAYINSKTKNTDFAVQYLSLLVSDDYLSWGNDYQKSYLANDKDSYFYLSLGENKVENEYKKIKVPAGEDDYMSRGNVFLVDNGEDIFVNAAPRIYTGSLEEMINEVYDGLNEGKLTAEEAADKIYSEASYQLME